MPRKALRINLTSGQAVQLASYFDRVRAAAVQGNPGMLIAQIHWENHEGKCWMVPAFLPHEHAKLITEKGEA